MKIFETDTLRFTVREGPVDGTWEVLIEAPGTKLKPVLAMSGGAGPETHVAVDLLNQMANIYNRGIAEYVKAAEREWEDVDVNQLKTMAAGLFKVVDAVGGHDELTKLANKIQQAGFQPEEWSVVQQFQDSLASSWKFGNLKIEVKPRQQMSPEIVGFYVRFEVPGVLYEDLMQRPMTYLLSNIAKEQVLIMRRTLEMGIDAAARHFLKANYLGPEYLPQMTQHATNIDRIARAIGDAELARLEGIFDQEVEKELETREEARLKMVKVVDRMELERLEDRERQLVRQIEALKKRLKGRKP